MRLMEGELEVMIILEDRVIPDTETLVFRGRNDLQLILRNPETLRGTAWEE